MTLPGLKNASPFVGRQAELAELNLLLQKKSASLVVVSPI